MRVKNRYLIYYPHFSIRDNKLNYRVKIKSIWFIALQRYKSKYKRTKVNIESRIL